MNHLMFVAVQAYHTVLKNVMSSSFFLDLKERDK